MLSKCMKPNNFLRVMKGHKLKATASYCLHAKLFIACGAIFTIYCLFGQDIRSIAFKPSADSVFDWVTGSAFVFFSIEIALGCFVNKGYSFSFFFFLDVISTITLALDLSIVGTSLASSVVSKTSRASRAGTKASRVIKVIRLIRLLRISKVFKAMVRKDEEQSIPLPDDDSENSSVFEKELKPRKETQMGVTLSKLTSQRIIIIVLLMVFGIPQFEVTSQFQYVPDLHQVGLQSVNRAYSRFVSECRSGNSTRASTARRVYEQTLVLFVTESVGNVSKNKPSIGWIGATVLNSTDFCLTGHNGPSPTFLWKSLNEPSSVIEQRLALGWDSNCDPSFMTTLGISVNGVCPLELRPSEKTVMGSIGQECEFEIVVDSLWFVRSEAFLSIYRTLVICAILGIGTFAFSESAFKLALDPINSMIDKVDRIRENPLHASRIEDDFVKRDEVERLRRLAKYSTATNFVSRWMAKRSLAKLNRDNLETEILERTIMRISGLLSLGFGEAGAAIVAHNMKSTDPAINVMLPGKRVDAVFASIQIKHFGTISAVLNDRIVLFINQIAEIVHSIADEFHGVPNKSDGESFLIVWRLSDDAERNRQIHDMSVVACVKICIAIRRSLELHEYSSLPPLMQKVPGFKVELNFCLHRGWAIEGAIGSDLKIDPSYLGPDVNLVETLSTSNAIYRTWIIASDTMKNGCSSSLGEKLFRRIDKVRLTGSRQSLYIYSLDLDPRAEILTQYEIENAVQSTSTHPSRRRQGREREKRKSNRWGADMHAFLRKDQYFLLMRKSFDSNPLILKLFNKGFLNYEAGEWPVASDAFSEMLNELGHPDGPAIRILELMRNNVNTV